MHARFGCSSKAKYKTFTLWRVFVRLFQPLSCMSDVLLAMVILLGYGAQISLVIPFCTPFILRMRGIFLHMYMTSLLTEYEVFQLSFQRLSQILQIVLKGVLF